MCQLETPLETLAVALARGATPRARHRAESGAGARGPLRRRLAARRLFDAERGRGGAAQRCRRARRASAAAAARALRHRGVGTVIVTLGGPGLAGLHGAGATSSVPAFPVTAVDTTAAGRRVQRRPRRGAGRPRRAFGRAAIRQRGGRHRVHPTRRPAVAARRAPKSSGCWARAGARVARGPGRCAASTRAGSSVPWLRAWRMAARASCVAEVPSGRRSSTISEHVDAGVERQDRGLADPVLPLDRAHPQIVADDRALEAELAAQQRR